MSGPLNTSYAAAWCLSTLLRRNLPALYYSEDLGVAKQLFTYFWGFGYSKLVTNLFHPVLQCCASSTTIKKKEEKSGQSSSDSSCAYYPRFFSFSSSLLCLLVLHDLPNCSVTGTRGFLDRVQDTAFQRHSQFSGTHLASAVTVPWTDRRKKNREAKLHCLVSCI